MVAEDIEDTQTLLSNPHSDLYPCNSKSTNNLVLDLVKKSNQISICQSHQNLTFFFSEIHVE